MFHYLEARLGRNPGSYFHIYHYIIEYTSSIFLHSRACEFSAVSGRLHRGLACDEARELVPVGKVKALTLTHRVANALLRPLYIAAP